MDFLPMKWEEMADSWYIPSSSNEPAQTAGRFWVSGGEAQLYYCSANNQGWLKVDLTKA